MIVCDNGLESVKFNSFVYSDGSVSRFHVSTIKSGGHEYPVYSFHSKLRMYGTKGYCVTLPKELSVLLDDDRKSHLWFVELFYTNEEHFGPKHVFHKFIRTVSGYDCVPIPPMLVDDIEDVPWTVVISPLDKYMLNQYDGFVYSSVVLDKSMFDFYTMLGL